MTPLTPEQIETVRAAVRVKMGLQADPAALLRGMPRRHAVEWTLTASADFILRQFACDESETKILTRKKFEIGND